MNKVGYIRLKHAKVGYVKAGRSQVVATFDDLSFDKGEVVALVGLNGAGKSTLMRSISGLQPLISGDVFIGGRKLRDMPLASLSTTVGIVLTQKVGGFNLKVADAVSAGRMPYTDAFHRLSKNDNDIVDAAMERCGVAAYSNLPLHELSDGMYQKTMIARALAQDTPVLLLDEPTAFLDYASKHALFSLLWELSREGRCVVISTHELDLAVKYCDKVLLVSGGTGRLLSAKDALLDEAFKALGGGHLK